MMHKRLIIIGSGPAALTAAIYASRAGVKPLVIEGKNPGGQLMSTSYVENWPGIQKILGPQLMIDMRAHAAHYGTEFLSDEVISSNFADTLSVTTAQNNSFYADTIIIASGATPKRLGIPGEAEYWGKGVTTCAICDGALYKNGKAIIVGGGDTAMEDASFMTNFTDDITIIHIRDKFTASVVMQERIIKNPQIKKMYNSQIVSIKGDGNHVTEIMVKNEKEGSITTLSCDVLFVAIGLTPNTAPFKNQLELLKNGSIAVTQQTHTSVPGVFAAGDVVDTTYRQAITAAGSGCMAALDAERYLKSIKIR